MANRERNSTETLYTFENRSFNSNWSMVMSTTHVPGMDAAMGGDGRSRRVRGRRRLRVATLALGALLTMHCRLNAAAVSGGIFVFIMFLVASVIVLANPLRHFEIYLGQWSISGPGRAFRMTPMFDGIGIAMCINAIVRAIVCCTLASISAVYVLHSVSDSRLPFTYCRDFNLNPYEPTMKEFKGLRIREHGKESTTVGLSEGGWRNLSIILYACALDLITLLIRPPSQVAFGRRNNEMELGITRHIPTCKEAYPGPYPQFFRTPAYNFFYVEVIHVRPDLTTIDFNIFLLTSLLVFWILIWLVMIKERINHGRLIWNNMYSWFLVVPCIWAICLVVTALFNIPSVPRILNKTFKLGTMDTISAIADALQVAIYIHSSSTGTELILGKGLNHYASGHIDTNLNYENIWHSGILLLLAVCNSISSVVCALADLMHVTMQEQHILHESTLWIIPMYSKCTSTGPYSHFLSALVFAGMTFSYLVVAYMFLKAALHTIFEYKVKLVFIEQIIVAILIITCMGLSLFFVFLGGIALLESVDAVMTGIAMPLLCFQELIVMLWMYRSRDFISDLNVATEENTCPTRVGTQWQLVPFILMVLIGMKIAVLSMSELPLLHLYWALLPLAAVVLAVPLRATWNAYYFFKRNKTSGN